MPVWRLTDNSDSISGQRRRHKYQRPTKRERRAIIDAHLAGDEWKRDFKTIVERHGQSTTAINTPARSSAGREAALSTKSTQLDESKNLLVMCLEDYPQLTLKHLALILQQSGCRRRGRRCRYTLDGWRRRILLDGISIAMQSVTGDQVAAQCRHSNTLLPECSTKSDI